MALSFERVLAELGETFSQPPLEPAAGTDSGVVNAYIYTHSGPLVATLSAGTLIRFTPLNTNTGPSTINVNSTGVVAITGATGAALAGGELSSLGPVFLQYNGTTWQIVSTTGATVASGLSAAGTDSGAVNAYVYTHNAFSLAATLTAGTLIRFTPLNTNTGASTLNADGTGAVAIIRANGSACTGGELSSLGPVVLQSTGTQWQIVSTAGAQPGFERTSAEINAGVTPTSFSYPPGDTRRHGAKVDGVTDDRIAINNAYLAFVQGNPPPFWAGTSFVSQNAATGYALQWSNDIVLNGNGKAQLIGDGTNNYTLIYANGSSVKIDIRGLTFDGKKSAPVRTADNNDICLRIQGTITTINIEDCVFQNYNEDGIYFNSTVSGVGGSIHHNKFNNGYRSGVTLVKGQYVAIERNDMQGILLNSVSVQATDNATVCRQISVDYNRIVGGGTANGIIDNIDRAAIFIAHASGASASVMGQYTCRGNVIKDFGVGYAGASLALGVETRQLSDVLVSGNEVTGCFSAGLYSFLTTRASYIGNHSCSNDKGLWMNECTDYSDIGNTCANNTTKDRDYHGPDGATTYLRADGLNSVLARASVTVSGGVSTLNSSFNIASVTHVSTGLTKFTFSKAAGIANYSVIPVFRNFSGTAGVIQSTTHNTTDFSVLTITAGVVNDESYDLIVVGPAASVTEPP